jgi:opacity protein-like surface antigen
MKKILVSSLLLTCLTSSLFADNHSTKDSFINKVKELPNMFDDIFTSPTLSGTFIGASASINSMKKTSSGTVEFLDSDKNINYAGKAGFFLDEDIRVYGQIGKLYSSDTTKFDYTSYSANIEVDLADKYGWKPFVGAHIGIGIAEKTTNDGRKLDDTSLEYGAQAGIRKKISEHIEAEGGYRWTKQSTQIVDSTLGNLKNNNSTSFYSNLNIIF